MLDDPNAIAAIDAQHSLQVVASQGEQLAHDFSVTLALTGPLHNVVVSGMGGSALAADFLQTWKGSQLRVPLIINREYSVPGFVGATTLFIASSYSGNTAEALSAVQQALQHGAQVVVMSSGGELSKYAVAHGLPLVTIPSGLQPRMAVLYELKALAVVLETAQLAQGWTNELASNARWLGEQLQRWAADVPTESNLAKQLAGKLHGTMGVVYAGPTLGFAARKFKIDLNENAKNLAFSYELPEFDHNEFQGWLHPESKPLTVIELQSSLDAPAITKRFAVSNELLAGAMPAPIVVQAEGKTPLQQLLWAVGLAGMTSLYVALLNGEDPIPVELVERLKKELEQA